MKIRRVEAHWMSVPDADTSSADQAQEALVVAIETDDGLVGLGECNHSPVAARAFLDAPSSSSQTRNVRELLVGRDLVHPEEISRELRVRTQSSARRGIGLAVLNALDVALWDLWAQSRREPLWRTLWGESVRPPPAYATLYTGPGEYGESTRRLGALAERAIAAGYRAVKVEPLDDCVPEERIAKFVEYGRRLVGDSVELLVDVYHRFPDAQTAARAIQSFADVGPHLVETPLPLDEVAGYAELARLVAVPLAASELYEAPSEFEALLRFGDLAVAQPWPNRVGVSGTRQVIDTCRRLGRRCMLAGWNATSVGVAVNVHLAAGIADAIVLEHAPTNVYDTFALRPVAGPEPVVVDGRFSLPEAPGLGVTLDRELLDRFVVR